MKKKKFAISIVTYNRSSLLKDALSAILKLDRELLGAVFVIDNNSTDDTQDVLKNEFHHPDLIHIIKMNENTGGAGGFSKGIQCAYEAGFEWIGVVDDDVLLDSNCLNAIDKFSDQFKSMIAVREDSKGKLFELSALKYNLSNPFVINPKRELLVGKYQTRDAMPEFVKVENVAFEGFFINRSVVKEIGFPYVEYFIFADDIDYSLRVRNAGYEIMAIRDAKITRQLQYEKVGALGTWKGYYMLRNFFCIHFLYGENLLVRLKPYFLTGSLYIVKPFIKLKESPSKILKDAKNLSVKLRKFN